MVPPLKKRPLKTFDNYMKMSSEDTDLNLDLSDSLEDQVYVTLTLSLELNNLTTLALVTHWKIRCI